MTNQIPRPPAECSYLIQPRGLPDEAVATIEGQEVDIVLDALLDAVSRWDRSIKIRGLDRGLARLARLGQAISIMATAARACGAPIVQANLEDRRAARQWRQARRLARSGPGRGAMAPSDDPPSDAAPADGTRAPAPAGGEA